ncbi:hypothetical protein LCGC14_1307390 [marine sediment metagenome]|uniref:Uncharacterized protein n=1 Tax=marine sediment metagenome TaxID=412755 RepID=A0A0F9N4G6_9ZZZZ
MIDKYTRAILTIIAAALIVLIVQNYDLDRLQASAYVQPNNRPEPIDIRIVEWPGPR